LDLGDGASDLVGRLPDLGEVADEGGWSASVRAVSHETITSYRRRRGKPLCRLNR
jgi:hypothetical protein